MASFPVPPIPPSSLLSAQDQIETYTKMLKSLEESAKYQEEAIAYHTQSLELLVAESQNTQSQLDLCQNTIGILSQTQKLTLSNTSKSLKNGKNERKALKKVEEKAVTAKKSKSPSKTKSKPPSKTKLTKVTSKKKQNSKQEKGATTKQSIQKGQKKTKSTLPPSSVLDKYENITAMVLDFVQKKKGAVVEVSQIIKYIYPKGLSKEERKKAFSSFSSVLSLSMKRGILERTVPGKYRWIGK